MKLKSYFSGSVEAAMELARKELGDEALLIHARPASPESRYLGSYEVVFGLASPSSGQGSMTPEGGPLRSEMESLRRQVQRLSSSIGAPGTGGAPGMGEAAGEIDETIAQKLNQGARLQDLFRVDASLGCAGEARAVAAFVGPPGAGKTTTLAKLAVRCGIVRRKSTHILTTDLHRVAAADQLRALAAILGLGCDAVEHPQALTQHLTELRGKQLILIDTPGFSVHELGPSSDAADLAAALSALAGIDIHLVLPASMKAADITRVVDRYRLFQPSKLIFTHIDETTSYGALLNEAARTKLPISFLGTGQEIPGDLEEATVERIQALVFGDRPPGHTALARRGAAA
ncbi:MAG: hypothetical protein WDO18_10150 [Acidobacteriota bacterium]